MHLRVQVLEELKTRLKVQSPHSGLFFLRYAHYLMRPWSLVTLYEEGHSVTCVATSGGVWHAV